MDEILIRDGGQECGVHIALHDTGSIAQHVPALAQTLLRAGSGAVIVLREFQGLCVELPKFAVGSFSLTTQFEYQRAYRFDFRRPSESLLEGRVVQLFGLDPIAQAQWLFYVAVCICLVTAALFDAWCNSTRFRVRQSLAIRTCQLSTGAGQRIMAIVTAS